MIKIIPSEVSLGRIKVGQPKSMLISIKNEGNEDVHIQELKPGCGSCTTARMDNMTIRAGETEQMKVVFTPSGTSVNSVKTVKVILQTGETKIFTMKSVVTN